MNKEDWQQETLRQILAESGYHKGDNLYYFLRKVREAIREQAKELTDGGDLQRTYKRVAGRITEIMGDL